MRLLPARAPSVVLALLALLLASCEGEQPPARGVKGGDGTLRLSFVGEPRSLNPNLDPLDEYALFISQNIFSKLVSLTDDGTVLPDAAERWTESADGLAYTFVLRNGVRWHDGQPLTAEDVSATFDRIDRSSNHELAARVAGVDVVDARTVRIRLKTPWAAFITNLAWFGASILPAHVYGDAAWEGHPANASPIGSGPFKFASWERGRRILLVKNPDYFGQGPYLDAIEFTIVGSAADAIDRLVNADADLLFGRPPAALVAALAHSPGVEVTTRPSDARLYLAFNMRRPPFDDIRARRAANLAIDRRALVDRVLAGFGTPATGFYIPSVGWAYNGNARVPPHDRVAARRLVARAVPPGTRVTLAIPVRGGRRSALGDALTEQLRGAGFDVRLSGIEIEDYRDALFARHDFDLAVLSGAQGPDPDNMAVRFASNGSMQVMGYHNAELDAALERAGRQTDPVARAASYHRAQELLAIDLPIAPLYDSVEVAVFRRGLRGLPHEDARGLVPFFTFNLTRLRVPE